MKVADSALQVEVPLAVRQLTSGQEVLLRIDLEALGDQALRGLRAQPEVAATTEAFRRSGREQDARVDEIVADLGRRIGLPLSHQEQEDALLVEVGLSRLIEQLVKRLALLDEVEYAELNRMLDLMSRRSSPGGICMLPAMSLAS